MADIGRFYVFSVFFLIANLPIIIYFYHKKIRKRTRVAVSVFFVRAPFSLCVCAHVFEINETVVLTTKTIFYRKKESRVGEVTSS